jgi:hypothetical protein
MATDLAGARGATDLAFWYGISWHSDTHRWHCQTKNLATFRSVEGCMKRQYFRGFERPLRITISTRSALV